MRTKEIQTAENVRGAKMIIDSTSYMGNKNALFNFIAERCIDGSCHWEGDKIVAMFEDSIDCKEYWQQAKKQFSYSVVENCLMCENVPNWDKIWKRLNVVSIYDNNSNAYAMGESDSEMDRVARQDEEWEHGDDDDWEKKERAARKWKKNATERAQRDNITFAC